MTINIQPPPTWTLPIDTKSGSFDPVWLKWFIDLAGVLNQNSGSPHIQHNSLGGLQGGKVGPPTEYYHLTSAQDGLLTSGTAHQVLHGDPTLPTWSTVSLTADISGVLPIANGGTNSSTALSGSSIAISNGTAIVQGVAGTTSTVLHGNASGAPTYSAISLTVDVSGTLPVGNGGTGSNSAPSSGQLPIGNVGGTAYAPQSMSGDATISNAGALTLATVATAGANTKITFNAKGLVTSAAAATLASSDFANQGTTTTVLHGNASGNPSWAAVSLSADVSGTLQAAQEPAHTGDVTNSAGSLALTIAAQAVTYAKIQNVSATSRFLGRKTAGAGSTEELAASDAKTILGYTLASSDFVNQGTTATVLHGNAAGNPSWASLSLTSDITGVLAEAHGGTNNSSYTLGDLLYASAANTLSVLAGNTTSTQKVLAQSGTGSVSAAPSWVDPFASTRIFVGSTTRDLTTASGNQAITGVGFTSKAILIITVVDGSITQSVGFHAGSSGNCVFARGTSNFGASGGNVILAFVSAGNNQSAQIASFDSDGFTFTWSKTGSPTGTLTIYYAAFR